MIKVPKFKKASEAATWIADTIKKDNWTVGKLAITIDGRETVTDSPEAAKFCALGWIAKADQGFEDRLREALAKSIDAKRVKDEEDEWGCDFDDIIANYNDSLGTPTSIKTKFRKAAKLLEAGKIQAKPKAKKKASKPKHTKG